MKISELSSRSDHTERVEAWRALIVDASGTAVDGGLRFRLPAS